MNAVHGVVVLAAGASRRLGRPKQLVEIGGETLLQRTLHAAAATEPADMVVVLGHAAEQLAPLVATCGARVLVTTQWQHGMGHSLRQGVAALAQACSGVLVVLCDQPALDAAHLQHLCRRWQAAPEHAVASGYADVIGVPALLPRAWLRDWQPTQDAGARALLRDRADAVDVVMNAALARDIDTPQDL